MAESVAKDIEANFCLAWLRNQLIYSAILHSITQLERCKQCQEKDTQDTHDFCYQKLGRAFGPRLARKKS